MFDYSHAESASKDDLPPEYLVVMAHINLMLPEGLDTAGFVCLAAPDGGRSLQTIHLVSRQEGTGKAIAAFSTFVWGWPEGETYAMAGFQSVVSSFGHGPLSFRLFGNRISVVALEAIREFSAREVETWCSSG